VARFDVYSNPDKPENTWIPFYLDVQSDHMQGLETRVVVPLWDAKHFEGKAENLHPEFEFDGRLLVMDTPALGAVPKVALRKAVANLTSHQLTIQDALDALFGAY
jgi:toxin CcdB